MESASVNTYVKVVKDILYDLDVVMDTVGIPLIGVVPEDVKELAGYVLAHRLVLMSSFSGDEGKRKLIDDILASTEIMTEDWSR